MFLIIGLFYLILGLIFGKLFLTKPISFVDNKDIIWLSWYIILLGNGFRIIGYTFLIFIQGMNKMKSYYTILSVQKIIYLFIGVLIMLRVPNILYLSAALCISMVVSTLYGYYVFKKYTSKIKFTFINQSLFNSIWGGAWRSGITKIISPVFINMNGIIFAQFAIPDSSSSFLLTERLFKIIRGFSDLTFTTFLPRIARLRSKKNFKKLNILIKSICLKSYLIILIGYIIIITFGEKLLILIQSEAKLAPMEVVILFSFFYLISRIGGFQNNLATQANNIIEHKAIMINSLTYFIVIALALNFSTQMLVFPLAMIISQLLTNFYIFRYSYNLYNTTFYNAEKWSFIPIFIILIFINIIFKYHYPS